MRIVGGWTSWKTATNPFLPPISILTGILRREIWREKCSCLSSGRPFGETLDRGELRLLFQNGKFFVQYFDAIFPLMPRSYRRLLKHRIDELKNRVVRGFGRLPGVFGHHRGLILAFGIGAIEPRVRKSGSGKTPFEKGCNNWCLKTPDIAKFIDENMADLNGKRGDAASLNAIEHLLEEQHFRLAYWQDPNEGINYRRFFAITDLVGIRAEDPVVFDATHDPDFPALCQGSPSRACVWIISMDCGTRLAT